MESTHVLTQEVKVGTLQNTTHIGKSLSRSMNMGFSFKLEGLGVLRFVDGVIVIHKNNGLACERDDEACFFSFFVFFYKEVFW